MIRVLAEDDGLDVGDRRKIEGAEIFAALGENPLADLFLRDEEGFELLHVGA